MLTNIQIANKIPEEKFNSFIKRTWEIPVFDDYTQEIIRTKLDEYFPSGYSIYPNFEFGVYNVYPPEGVALKSAWRHNNLDLFAFLTEHSYINRNSKSDNSLLLHVAGLKEEVYKISSTIDKLKVILKKERNQHKNRRRNEQQFEDLEKTKVRTLSVFFALFTAAINCFALFSRKIPLPIFVEPYQVKTLSLILFIFHFLANITLIVFTFFVIILLIKTGWVICKKI